MDIKIALIGDKKLLKKFDALKGFYKSTDLRRLLEDAKNTLVRGMRHYVPRRSRFLSQSINAQVIGFGTKNPAVKGGASAKYAGIVEAGSPPHKIRPKTKQALFWVDYAGAKHFRRAGKRLNVANQGVTVFAFRNEVNHPGFKARPFVKPTYEKVRPRFFAALRRIVNAKLRSG